MLMHAALADSPRTARSFETFPSHDEFDPLAEDAPVDGLVVTTERRLRRLVIAATDAGSRFTRDRLAHDPAAWMLTPLECMDGERPIDACQDRTGFLRACLVNHLGLGVDASPDALDALVGDDELPEDFDPAPVFPCEPEGRRLLFSASIDGLAEWGGERVRAFCAMVAPSREAATAKLTRRYGALMDGVEVVTGFDRSALAVELLSPSSMRILEAAAGDPDGPSDRRLDIQAERRTDA